MCPAGCLTQKNALSLKSEEELDEMERQSESLAFAYDSGRYDEAVCGYAKLAEEMTVSRSLYRLNAVPPLVFTGRGNEAHAVMTELRVELEELFSVDSEKKALSKWRGEVNKLFKGDAHEIATFYALLAMSYAKRGEIENAWRCVQNGLLHDGDSRDGFQSDYALLLYLGSVYARRLGELDFSEQCKTRLVEALQQRGVRYDEDQKPTSPIAALFSPSSPNGMIAVWTGTSPRYGRSGKHGNRRVILRGDESAFDYITVTSESGDEYVVSQRLGDINFQASTRGGRMMDGVLRRKADFKEDMKAYEKASHLMSEGFFQAGLPGDPFAKATGFALGTLTRMVESGFSTASDSVDARADIRSWRTLPGQINLLPLRMSPGEHILVVRGYVSQKVVAEKRVGVKISPDASIDIVHVKMNDLKVCAEAEVVRKARFAEKTSSRIKVQDTEDQWKRMVGVWRCWMDVEIENRTEVSSKILSSNLPVSTEITMELSADGSARLTELEGRLFGYSSGEWKFRNGMLELSLQDEKKRRYRMAGIVTWNCEDIFSLRYTANDWRDMVRQRCVDIKGDVTAGCTYKGDKMNLTFVVNGGDSQMVQCLCTINVFRRQWGL